MIKKILICLLISVLLIPLINTNKTYGVDLQTENSYFVEKTSSDKGIKKLCICYCAEINKPENQQFIAEKFDMLDCGKAVSSSAQNIKNLNPDIEIIGYYDSIMMQDYYSDWNYVNSHEDWFAHDIYGNRIKSPTWGSYLMNPNSGWSNYYADKALDFLNSNTHYSGIFADDVAYDLQETGYSWSVDYNKFEDGLIDNWGAYMKSHISNLQSKIGDNIVMPNAWKYTVFCEKYTNVHFWEGFVHGRSHSLDSIGYGEWYTKYAIDTLHIQAEKGNTIAVLSGTKNADSDPVKAEKIANFTLSCFLFAIENLDKSYFSWNFFRDDSSKGYMPIMDYKFGQPKGDYYLVIDSVYARNFENSIVVANIGLSSSTFEINNQEYTLEGRTSLIIEATSQNTPPVISDIPDQKITQGQEFSSIKLDDYVYDLEDTNSQISWSYSGNTDLLVTIDSNNIATLQIPYSKWHGEVTITFIATDSGGLKASDSSIFNVTIYKDKTDCVFSTPKKGHIYSKSRELLETNLLDLFRIDVLALGPMTFEININESKHGKIGKVEFYVENQIKDTKTGNICNWSWQDKVVGKYLVRIIAFNSYNAEILRDEIRLFIINLKSL